MKPTLLSGPGPGRRLSCLFTALFSGLAAFNLPAFTYTDFSSTNGLSLLDSAAQSGAVLRLTPAAESRVGNALAINKQQCGSGFDTRFQFLISNPGSRPGTPSGADGFMFVVQNTGPTESAWHPPLTPPPWGCERLLQHLLELAGLLRLHAV